MNLKPKWPRGRYNGRRIVGLKLCLSFRCDNINLIPVGSWNWGEPYIQWLGLRVQAEALYHWMDA